MHGSIDLLIAALDYCTTTPAVHHFTSRQLRDMEQLCNDLLAGRVAVIRSEKSSLEVAHATPIGATLDLFGQFGADDIRSVSNGS